MLNARSRSRPAHTRGISIAAPSLYQVSLLAMLGAILIVALAPRLDTDFWWHLKVGQYIAARHAVPSHDFMTYTFAGHAWTDHEWLSELTMWALYRLAGFWGPICFFAFVICTAFALVYARMRRRGAGQVVALFVLAASFVASSASWGPRIQMLTLLFLSAFMLVLEQYSACRDRRLLALFPVLMILWANLHGGFVLGLVVIAITLAGEWLNQRTSREGHWAPADLKHLAIAFGVTAGVTVCNPNGLRQLIYPLTFVLPNPFTNLIEESASPNFHMPVMMLFEALLLALIASAFLARKKASWTDLLLIIAFTHLALAQVRNVAVWAVVIGPIVAVYLHWALPELWRILPIAERQSRPVRPRVAAVLNVTMLILVAAAYALEAANYVNASTLRRVESTYPVGAVTYMMNHRLPRHVYVSYGWGGYLLWRAFPEYRDFMDSRADTLFTARMLHAYLDAYAGAPDWRAVLRQYQVGTVLVEARAPLAQLLGMDRSWRLRYRDRDAVVFTRV
ncbi:MAG TPA: hypothetical protein VKX16_17415 [Chloroflexota bacterium]|nr:hypothetical protein [Chloroflexota bacterium]